jgi:hypothetical protein
MVDTYVPESRWRMMAAVALIGGGLLLGGVALVRSVFGGAGGGS